MGQITDNANVIEAWVFPGSGCAALINAKLADLSARAKAAGPGVRGVLHVFSSRYTLDQKLRGADVVDVVCDQGKAQFSAGWSMPVAAADDPTNGLVDASGTLDPTTFSGTLAATAAAGSTQLTLAVAAGVTAPADGALAGKYLVVRGYNGNDNSQGDSDGTSVIVTEVVKVSTNTGLTVTLAAPTAQHHSVYVDQAHGCTVTAVVPVVGFGLRNVDLSAEGGTIAVGVQLSRSVGFIAENVSFAGFSRAVLDGEGMRDGETWGLHSRGEVNAIFFGISCLNWQGGRVTCEPFGARNHANGIPRGLITTRFRCTNVRWSHLRLQHACIGIMRWGGRQVVFEDVEIRDMNPDAAVNAMVTAGEHIGGNPIGAGYSGGAAPLALAEFGWDEHVTDITVNDISTSTTDYTVKAYYCHDGYEQTLHGVKAKNGGIVGYVGGFHAVDVSGVIADIEIIGHSYGFTTDNVYATLDVHDATISCIAGYGANGVIPMRLNHGQPGLRFRKLTCGDGAAFVRFGAQFGDSAIVIDRYTGNAGQLYSNAVIAYAGAAQNVNDIVEIDQQYDAAGGANANMFTKARTAAADTRLAIVAVGGPYDTTTGWCFIVPLPVSGPTTVLCTGTVKHGDYLVADGTTLNAASAVVGTPTAAQLAGRVGKAITGKGSAGTAALLVVPA